MRWFWADLHFDQSLEQMKKLGRVGWASEDCIEAINERVAKQDWLYLLGDFAFKRPGYWKQQIRCRHIFLILGNHDPSIQKIQNVFGGNYADTKVVKCRGVPTFLSHYPCAFWDGSHHGSFHLYGHIHAHAGRELVLNYAFPERRSMDVSPESSIRELGELRPFDESDVSEILGGRKGHDMVSFSHAHIHV